MAPKTLSARELFDPAFLESVQRLRITARRVPRGGRHAEQRSRDLGTGIEFRDFRPYAPGDDFRAIDWNIYRRLHRVFLRLFEELEDLPVYLLPDISKSLFLEDPPRIRPCLRTALALAAISLGQHDTVGLLPFGKDLHVELKPQAGHGKLFRFAEHLARLGPQGQTDFATSLKRLATFGLRKGLVVIISDFFDPRGIDRVTEALKGVRHRLLLVQLHRKTDRDPDLEGDLQLIDCETGDAQDVSVTAPVLQDYRKAYDRFQEGLVGFARRSGSGLLRIDAASPIVPQLAELFEGGAYVV